MTTITKRAEGAIVQITAHFASGSKFSFMSGPQGHRVAYAPSSNPAVEADRRATLDKFTRRQPGESDKQRLGRVEAFLRGVSSTTELVAAIKNSNFNL